MNDSANLGVDWTLTCGGSPAATPVEGTTSTGCGTILPSHTPSGVAATYTAPSLVPLESTVTITARVTSDPALSSSVTVTITSLPIALAFQSNPPTSLAVGGIALMSVLLTNDVTSVGANWTATCNSSDCGSFSSTLTTSGVQTTYTAPSAVPTGGAVTITATSAADSTKSISKTVTILPITVAVSPATFSVTASGTASLKATVTNDVKSAGVTWSCGSTGCGGFSSSKTASGTATTYTAPAAVPAGGTVTITATSANDGTTSASATATIVTATVLSVKITQTPAATIAEGKTAMLKATVTGDTTNAGVDWTATCGSSVTGACGTLNPTTTPSGTLYADATIYTAPSSLPPVNPVTIIATPHAYNLTPSLIANLATATTTITVPATIAFTQQPSASIVTSSTTTMSAVVTNDATSGGGVSWTVSCSNSTAGACGYVKPHTTVDGQTATYFAPPTPPGVTVKIQAASIAYPAVSVTAASPIAVVQSMAHSIAFVPFAPSQVVVGTAVNLNASVTNDSTNAGVDWAVCASGCGFFTTQAAIPEIPAVAASAGDPGSPDVPAVSAVIATSVQAWPNGLPISYTAPSIAPSEGVVITVSASVDRLNDVSSPATAVATVAITSESTGPTLQGVVQAGDNPIVGSSVYLYAAGTSGYASVATLLYDPAGSAFATTDSSGNFTIPAGYSCPASTSQVYLLALGGYVGTSNANPNLALMTALGPCSNLSSTAVVINEVTTVASATALAPFSANNIDSGESSYLYLGSSIANATVGMANAFASVNSLVDITTGLPKFNTIAGNATVPYVEMNTLADALDACAVTAGGSDGDDSVCGNLFTYANPVGQTAYAPTDTLQAVFDLVKPPDSTVSSGLSPSGVFGLAGVSSPFQPILTKAPNDWSISLNYTYGGGVGGSGTTASGSSAFAIDASGNLWITNTSINSVSEWNNFGAAISPSTSGSTTGGFTAGGLDAPGPLAIDPSGNIWIVNGNSTLTKLYNTGSSAYRSPYAGGGLTTGVGIAIDGLSDVWITNSGSPGDVAKFSNDGTAISTSGGYTSGILDPLPIAIDGSNNVWIQNQNLNRVSTSVHGLVELNDTSAATIFSTGNASITSLQPQMAIDSSGSLWWVFSSACGEISEMTDAYAAGEGQEPTQGFSGNQTLANSQGIAVDGASRLWVANSGAGSTGCNGTVAANVTLVDESANGTAYTSASLSNGPLSMAVDNAGNLWVLLSNNTVTEYVGLATPVVTPLALGVKNKKLASKP
jgi:hypothetical protein